MINVLLTCAGRRNYLINYFRQALDGRGFVFTADTSASAAAMQEADRAFLLPPVDHPDYFDRLLDLCRDHQIRLLFSLNDLELPLLARHRSRFIDNGTIPVVSSPRVIDLCFDKIATGEFLREIGIGVPRTFTTLEEVHVALDRGEIHFPLVIKPRWGTASIGIEYPESRTELELACRLGRLRLERSALAKVSSADRDRSLIFQEKLAGFEYGLDIVNDFQGRYITTFIKRKLSMRAGETDQAVTVDHPALEEVGRRIAESLRHIGNLDCDVFVCGEQFRVLELNPRFGGGYPFTHQGGANLPAAMIAWAQGDPIDPQWVSVRPGIASAKCDRLVLIDEEKCSGARAPTIFRPNFAEAAAGV